MAETPKKEEIFQDIKILNAPKPDIIACRRLLIKLLTMLNRGMELTEEEGNTIFFGLTFIFKEPNPTLKKIIYLTIKEMVHQASFYMITNSLLKDAKEKIDANRIDALKVIPYVIGQNNAAQSEQLFKGAILDKNQNVANAAIMASHWISIHEPDHIKKCVNDIQDLLLAKPTVCHYHALNVLYNIKKNDMMSFIKILLLIITKNSSYNVLTTIQLIRYCREVIESDLLDTNSERTIFNWLGKQLNKNNTIVIEVAKTMVAMRNISNNELTAVISSLSLYILSINSINVFAALKIYDKLVDNPARASLLTNSSEIESLLQSSNKAVKSLALGVLLKVCREDKIADLLDKTYDIFSDLPDSIKINVISSCDDISKKYPERTKEVILFLWKCLRDRGELEFKIKAIKKITKLMKRKSEFYDKVFDFFCEYIEDPFSSKLVYIILNVFSENIQHCSEPRKHLRFILNRLHLDEGKIRAAAISCLGEIGSKVPSIRKECSSIVSSYVQDTDDEVRERAFFYSHLLDDSPAFKNAHQQDTFNVEDLDDIQAQIRQSMSTDQPIDFDNLILNRTKKSETKVSLKPEVVSAVSRNNMSPDSSPQKGVAAFSEAKPDKAMLSFISSHEDFAGYGDLRLSRPAADISDKDSDFYVRVAKHFFDEFIVLEYIVANRDEQHDILDVSINPKIEKDDLQVCHLIENTKIANGQEGKVFMSLQKNPEHCIVFSDIKSVLEFKAQLTEGGEVTNEYNDEFACDEFAIKISDYIIPKPLAKGQFKQTWDAFPHQEHPQNFKVDYKTVDAAVSQVVKHFGMSVCENSDLLVPNSNFHTLYLSGLYLGIQPVYIVCQIGIEPKLGCVLKLRVKAEDERLVTNLLESLS